jgi:hypothetical protein
MKRQLGEPRRIGEVLVTPCVTYCRKFTGETEGKEHSTKPDGLSRYGGASQLARTTGLFYSGLPNRSEKPG